MKTQKKKIDPKEKMIYPNPSFLPGACSEVPKKRFGETDACCTDKKEWLDNNSSEAAKLDCPANRPIKPILASAMNLLARDASGNHHTFHLILSLQITKDPNQDCMMQSAAVISRKESCLRITPARICEIRPRRVELGLFFPHSSDYQSLKHFEAAKITQLATNAYLRQSSIFQHRLSDITNLRHRYARALPNSSQVYVMARYAYLRIKSGSWPINADAPFLSRVKIYDPKFIWRHQVAGGFNPSKTVLPPMSRLINEVRLKFKESDFIGNTQQSIDNRLMIDRLESKIRFECRNEEKSLIDSEAQCLRFQAQEFTRTGSAASGSKPYVILNEKGSHRTTRSPPAPTCLNDIEISLRPSTQTIAQYNGKSVGGASTSYKGEMESREDLRWPRFWNSDGVWSDTNFKTEAQLSLEVCRPRNLTLEFASFPEGSIIDYNQDEEKDTTFATETYTKSKRAFLQIPTSVV